MVPNGVTSFAPPGDSATARLSCICERAKRKSIKTKFFPFFDHEQLRHPVKPRRGVFGAERESGPALRSEDSASRLHWGNSA